MTKDKITLFNAPFSHHYSSCSTLKPRTFEWTDDLNAEYHLYADTGIISSMGNLSENSRKNNYAWIVESPEVVQHVVKYVFSNRKLISFKFNALFTCIESLVGLEPNFYYCPSGSNLPWITNQKIFNKTKLCSMFASNKRYASGHFYREKIANSFKQKSGFDLFGGTCGSSRIGGNGVHPDKSEGLNDYMFSIIIENCKENNYYTEKLTDCFVTGTVPIYWGSDKVFQEFNQDGIIKLDDNFSFESLTKELYESKTKAIQENFNKAQQLEMADDYLYRRIKELNKQ